VAGAGAADLPHHITLAKPCPLVELRRERLQARPILEVALVERVGQSIGGERVDLRDGDLAGCDRLGHAAASVGRLQYQWATVPTGSPRWLCQASPSPGVVDHQLHTNEHAAGQLVPKAPTGVEPVGPLSNGGACCVVPTRGLLKRQHSSGV